MSNFNQQIKAANRSIATAMMLINSLRMLRGL